MPETTTGQRPGLTFLQRFGVHILLVGVGVLAFLLAGRLDDEAAPSEPAAGGPLVVAELERQAPPSEVPAPQGAYARSPLVPRTPISEEPVVGQSTTAPIRPELEGRTQTATEGIEPLFVTHIVEAGETVSQLAQEFGIEQQTILDNNNEIVDPAALSIGQQLTLPTEDGVLHTVQLGQTLDEIGEVFEAETSEILNFPGNGLRSGADIQDGKVILVVGGQFPEPVEFQPVQASQFPLVIPSEGFLAGFPPARSEAGFILPYWPCSAPSAIQDFGYARGRLHAGVDMPSFCARSSNVYAAQSGTVVLADWNGGYGQLVVIDHGYGFQTYYAHLSQILVTRGQSVWQGMTVGVSGNTGASYGEHLHFEIRIGGQPTDPKPYLPWPWPY